MPIARSEAALAVATALVRVSQAMIGPTTMATALTRLCELTTEELHCDCSHVWLWDPGETAYTLAAGYGDSAQRGDALQSVRLTPHSLGSVHEQLLREGMVNLGRAAAGSLSGSGVPGEGAAQLLVAIRNGDELLGIHSASFRGREAVFTAQQEQIAHGIAQVATRAIHHVRAVEQLERTSQLKSEFAATMSHELRTPLSVIIGYTDLLREGVFGELTQPQADTLQRIDKRARELLEVINATLDFSRLEGGRLRLELGDVQVPELLATLEAESNDLQKKPGVTLGWQVAPGLPTLHTDAAKLKIVLKNLVGNALKFTQQGSVTVAAQPLDDGVELTVTDTGIGIDPDVMHVIFEPFQQGGAGIAQQFGGVGLGLHIVRGLLQSLGGNVSVESQPGRGSTFRVWLPRSCPASPPPPSGKT